MANRAVPSDWAMWQLVDSLLPTGAFAHSLGLEAALRQGFLGSPGGVVPASASGYAGGALSGASVRAFALCALANVASQLLPFVAASHVCMAPAALGPTAPEVDAASGAAAAGDTGHAPGGGGDRQQKSSAERESCGVSRQSRCEFAAVAAEARQILYLGEEDVLAGRHGWPQEGEAGQGAGQGVAALDTRSLWSPEEGAQIWAVVDSVLHACLTNHVARRASLGQGQALLRVALTISSTALAPTAQGAQGLEGAGPPVSANSMLKMLRARVLLQPKQQQQQEEEEEGGHQSNGVPALEPAKGHHATVFGAAAALLGIGRATAARAYLYGALRDVLSCATRLSLIGPLEAATLQASLAPEAERMLQSSAARPSLSLSLAQTPAVHSSVVPPAPEAGVPGLVGGSHVACPVLDVLQGAHDALPLRLFLS